MSGMSHLRSFRSHCGGNIAIITALLLPVFVAGTGVAVDMTKLYASKVNLQKSLDAAALAAAKEFGKTQDNAVLKKWAEAYFFTNAGPGSAATTQFSFEGVHMENGNAVLKVSAIRDEPMYFGGAILALSKGKSGAESYRITRSSEIVVQNRSIEMALVLDNSGSMDKAPAGGGKTKMTVLKEATNTLIDQMMAANPNSNVQFPVKMGIVPFSGAVNIGSDNANKPWMDTTGRSPSHHENFDWSTWKVATVSQAKFENGIWKHIVTQEALTRFYLLKNMRYGGILRYPAGWEGCVESRPGGLNMTDDEPTTTKPASLYVPLFAPTEYKWTGTGDTIIRNDYIPDGNNSGGNSDVEALTRQRDMNRYLDSTTKTNIKDAAVDGPNFICSTTPITPLTTTKSTLKSAITASKPLGATNIPEGLAWGWRVLSKVAPFTEGRAAKTEDNLKVLVLMTDGENTYNPTYSNGSSVEVTNANKSMFGTYGYGQILDSVTKKVKVGRVFDGLSTTSKIANANNYVAAMNEMTSKVCENIKNDGRNDDGSDGIVIFTIAFDLPDSSPIKTRLKACASSGINGNSQKLYYDARDADDLVAAFQSITEEISSLRIAR